MWEGLERAATVAQLAGVDAAMLVDTIPQAAGRARQNNRDFELLERRVELLDELLPRLRQDPQDPEAERALAGLKATLSEARELVESWQRKRRVSKFFTASRMADRFQDVEKKIDSYLLLIRAFSLDIPITTPGLDGTDHTSSPSHSHSQPTTLSREEPEDHVVETGTQAREDHVLETGIGTDSSGDDGALHRDEDDADGQHADEEDGDMGDSSRKPYQRGPAKLPAVPDPLQRPVVQPCGKTTFIIVSGTLNPRREPASILGVLCRKHYPGLVTHEDGSRKPAKSWADYKLGPDDEEDNKQLRVKKEFWRFFRPEEGKENKANLVFDEKCKTCVKVFFHEAKIQCHIDYYAEIKKEKINKERARQVTLTKEQYLQVAAWWCRSYRDCWEKIVDMWLSPAQKEVEETQRENSNKRSGPSHHQGSHSLPAFHKAVEAKSGGRQISLLVAWAMSKMGKASSEASFNPDAPPEAYSDPSVHTKIRDYTEAVKERHGASHDVSKEPLDAELVVSKSTSSSQPISQRPTRVEQLEAELAETRRKGEHLTQKVDAQNEMLEAQRAVLEAQGKKITELVQVVQNLGQTQGALVHLPSPLPVLHYTPPPSAGSNHLVNASPPDPANPSPQSGAGQSSLPQ